MNASPIPSAGIVTFTITVNGKAIPDTYSVISIEVHKALSKPSSASISIRDGSPATGEFPISDSNSFVFGTSLKISAGYDANESLIFSGTVIKQQIKLNDTIGSVLIITCKGDTDTVFDNKPDLTQTPVLTLSYGECILEMDLEQQSDRTIQGSVKFQGNALPEPGKCVELTNLGKRFSGNALVSGLQHILANGNWLSIIEL